jgi:DNA-binding NtrC family response regulator
MAAPGHVRFMNRMPVFHYGHTASSPTPGHGVGMFCIFSAAGNRGPIRRRSMTYKPHVLMVEDEVFIAMVLEDLLTDAGYAVRGVTSLAEGLRVAQADGFDAAILDVNLGRDLVFPLAEQLREQGVPFVFASGYGKEEIPKEFHTYETLLKPYDSKTMLNAIAKLLHNREKA